MSANCPWLEELDQIGILANSEDDFYDRVVELLQRYSGADEADLFLPESGDILVLRASTYTPEYAMRCRLGKGVGLCGKCFLDGTSRLISTNAAKDPDNVPYPGVDERDHDAVLVLPLMGLDEKPVGVCLLMHSLPWLLNASEQCKVNSLVESVSLRLIQFQSAHRLGLQSSRMGAVNEVARSIGSSPYLEEILQLLVNMTAQQLGYTVCTVRLLDEQRGELVLRATQAPARAYQRKAAIRLGESIAGKAIAQNRPVVVHDVLEDPDYIGHDLAAEQGLRSMVCLPLTVLERPVGVISCYTSELHEFDEAELAALETIAKQAAFAIEHAKLQVRSTLMQEMHHRVKNNLQQVVSLLRLQMQHGSYANLNEALEESMSRILAISSVHDLLSRDDLDHVGLRTLVESLAQIQRESLIAPDRVIRFEIRGDDVRLNTHQATQVALILNELIQNAIVHGFKNSLEGELHVTIEDYGSDVGLWVSNKGDSLPKSFDQGANANLGLKIVENLAKSLRGHFRLEERLGWTVAEVRFHKFTNE